VTVTIKDTTAPSISGVPGTIVASATSTAGAVVTFTAPTATDLVDGKVAVNCSPGCGTSFPVGKTNVTATATDAHSNQASASFQVWVQYNVSSIALDSSAKAGNSFPVKFTLTGASANITNASASLSYATLTGSVPGSSIAATSTSAATTGNLFRYSGGQYIFNWNTKGLAAGTYRLTIDLGDGVSHQADVTLK
jgi:hypothetical protein